MSEDAYATGQSFFSEEDMQTMRRNRIFHYVKLLFSNREETLVYQVDEETWRRVRGNVSSTPSDFCCFTTVDGREVAVNVARLDYGHFLWNAALPELAAVEDWPASIYFSGRQEAFGCHPEDGDEAFDVFSHLEAGIDDADPFMAITDEDGEVIVFDARHVDAIEMSAALVAEGAARFDAALAGDSEASDD